MFDPKEKKIIFELQNTSLSILYCMEKTPLRFYGRRLFLCVIPRVFCMYWERCR